MELYRTSFTAPPHRGLSIFRTTARAKDKTFSQDEQFQLRAALHIRWLLHRAGNHLCARGPDWVPGPLWDCVGDRNTWKHLHPDHGHQVIIILGFIVTTMDPIQ